MRKYQRITPAQKEWMKEQVEKLGRKPLAVAIELGVHPQTVYNHVKTSKIRLGPRALYITFKVPEEVAAAISREARQQNKTYSFIIREALTQYLATKTIKKEGA